MMQDKLRSLVIGGALGDALGVPYEFMSRESIRAGGEVVWKGWGTHNQPPGTWSDDTSLTLCLLDAMAKGLDYACLARLFSRWHNEAFLTAGDEVFDIGIATAESIRKMDAGQAPLTCGGTDEYSNGNGSLMRIAPLAFHLLGKEPEECRRICFEVSALTHGHKRSMVACWLYVEIIKRLVSGENRREAIDDSIHDIQAFLDLSGWDAERGHFARCNSAIQNLDEKEILSTGYVIHSLEAALFVFLKSRSFKEAVCHAVSLGNDTDTIAAITGSLAGVYFGMESMPAEWLKDLLKREMILRMCDEYCPENK